MCGLSHTHSSGLRVGGGKRGAGTKPLAGNHGETTLPKDIVNPLAIEGFVVLQAIAVAALLVLSFAGSAAFLRGLDLFFGSASAQQGQPVAVHGINEWRAAPVPRVVLLRTGLVGQFESLVSELSRCDSSPNEPAEAESVIARHFFAIRERALQILEESRKEKRPHEK